MDQSPTTPSYPLTPVPSQNPPPPQDTPSRPTVARKESIGPAKKNKKTKLGHDKPDENNNHPVHGPPSDSPGPISALHVPSQANSNGPMPPSHSNSPTNSYPHPHSQNLPPGLAHLTHPHPPQHQPYYGNSTNTSPSSYASQHHPPTQHSSHTMYTGGAFGVPLQYNGYGLNAYSLPPIGPPPSNSPNGYEYPPSHHHQQQHHRSSSPPISQRPNGAPVTGLQGLLNGVDGRGRDSRESSSAPAPYKKPSSDALMESDPGEGGTDRGQDANDENDEDGRRGSGAENASPATSKSPTKGPGGTRSPRKSNKQGGNAPDKRGASPGSGSEYHSAVSDGDYRANDDDDDEEGSGSGDDYTEEEQDDDDGSGAYRGSARRGGKGTKERPSRSVLKRQTRMSSGVAGAGLKRKRSLRGSSPAADE
ncbi:hypothetical protein F5880DRAFT_117560 [Lentinula raphanica]|nr:hypothetical protein F5880DRAFT_117560 [Lentinula raphanica]